MLPKYCGLYLKHHQLSSTEFVLYNMSILSNRKVLYRETFAENTPLFLWLRVMMRVHRAENEAFVSNLTHDVSFNFGFGLFAHVLASKEKLLMW